MTHRASVSGHVNLPQRLWPDVVFALPATPVNTYVAEVQGENSAVNYFRCDGTDPFLSAVGGVGYVTPGALQFDRNAGAVLNGSDAYLFSLDDDSTDPLTGSMTWELWATVAPSTKVQTLYYKADTTGANGMWIFADTDGLVSAILDFAGGGPSVAGVIPINDTRYHHVVVVFDRTTNLLSLYIDGVLDTAADASGAAASYNSAANLYLGVRFFSVNPSQYLRGAVDEVAVYQTALGSDRIAAHYRSATNPPTGVAGPAPLTYLGGPQRYSLPQDGFGVYGTTTSAGFTILAAMTFTHSIAASAVATPQTLLFSTTTSGEAGFRLAVSSGSLYWQEMNNLGGTTSLGAAVTTTSGTTVHVAIVHTASQTTCYVDGTSRASITATSWTEVRSVSYRLGQALNVNGATIRVSSYLNYRDVYVLSRPLSANGVAQANAAIP